VFLRNKVTELCFEFVSRDSVTELRLEFVSLKVSYKRILVHEFTRPHTFADRSPSSLWNQPYLYPVPTNHITILIDVHPLSRRRI